MPYTEEGLNKKNVSQLKKLYQSIQVHKSALPIDMMGLNGVPYSDKKTLKSNREKLAMRENREDLIFDSKAYSSQTSVRDTATQKEKKQKAYLIKKIIEVQDKESIGFYADESKYTPFDYVRDIDEIGAEIDPVTGHVKYPESYKPKPVEPDVPAEKDEEKDELTEPPKSIDEPVKKQMNIPDRVAARRKQRFDEDLDDFETELDYFKKANRFLGEKAEREKIVKDDPELLKAMDVDTYELSDLNIAQKKQLKLIRSMQNNLNYKDNSQIQQMKDAIEKFAKGLELRAGSKDNEILKQSQEIISRLGKKIGSKTINPIIQRIEDEERRITHPHERIYEDTNKPRLPSEQEQNAPLMQKSGDKAIGDVRSIGFLGPMDSLAKADDVLIPETERSKSIRRFTNFRWVDSIQNSKIGYDSPFQRMQDIDDRRRYGKCFMPTNPLPKDPDTQDNLDKTKGFNTYPLVPSYNLTSLMQPATEFSFKQSTNPHARKINIDERQFANKKLYNFEETDKRIRPINPFASSYGMESIEQSQRNPNNVKNTLEFSSVMTDDDPFKRIKDKYKTNIVA
jgi:hypothetical protein